MSHFLTHLDKITPKKVYALKIGFQVLKRAAFCCQMFQCHTVMSHNRLFGIMKPDYVPPKSLNHEERRKVNVALSAN